MNEAVVMLLVGGPLVLLAAALYWLDRVRRRAALYRWASDNGYRLLDFGQPIVTETSPFPLSVSKAQQVFWFELEDRTGAQRQGWVRLGTGWRGVASRKADVKWTPA